MDGYQGYRDERGRFLAGNPGGTVPGPGRPREAAAERLRAALREIINDDEVMAAWVAALKKKLKRGNLSASEFVIDRLLGRPAVVVQHSSDDDRLALFIAQWQAISLQGDDAPPALPAGEDEQARA